MTRNRIALLVAFPLALAMAGAAVPARAGGSPYVPGDAERARWTMSDMRSWVLVLSAYQKDNGKFPAAPSLESLVPLVQPIYIRVAPLTDAWGTGFKYVVSSDLTSFRLISAGADGHFDESSWSSEAKNLGFQEDAVAGPGALTRVWEYR